MSFSKTLMCKFCEKRYTIAEEKFPEDLFDLIVQHKISQLFWICKSCHFQKEGFLCNLDIVTDEIKRNSLDIKSMKEQLSAIHDTLQSSLHPITYKVGEIDNYGSFEDSSDAFDTNEEYFVPSFKLPSPQSSNDKLLRSPINKSAHTILEKILKKIKPGEEEEKKCHEIVKTFMSFLIEELKKDPEFNQLYGNLYYTGSSYNDLRISSATEYDIDIILKCPPQISTKLQVEFVQENYSFAKIKWEPLDICLVNKIMLKFSEEINGFNYLIPLKINSWFQSKLAKCNFKSFKMDDEIVNITDVQSGPARTVKIYTNFEKCIDLDLVPVFCFKYDIFSQTNISKILEEYPIQAPEKEICLFVPKPLKGGNKLLSSIPQDQSIWRLDLPEVEKDVLRKKACAKPVIKLMKLLRDNYDWKGLASYYLKTVILIQIKNKPDGDYWKQQFLYERFIEALKVLRDYLEKGEIPCFFSSSYNLIYQLNQDQCTNWKNKLSNIIKKIESDCNYLNKCLLEP